jgi:hypothetical protein
LVERLILPLHAEPDVRTKRPIHAKSHLPRPFISQPVIERVPGDLEELWVLVKDAAAGCESCEGVEFDLCDPSAGRQPVIRSSGPVT